MHEIGNLLRKLHRTSQTESSLTHSEKIKSDIQSIWEKHLKVARESNFISQLITILKLDGETQAFATRWLQLELDALSYSILAKLQSKKKESPEVPCRKSGVYSNEAKKD